MNRNWGKHSVCSHCDRVGYTEREPASNATRRVSPRTTTGKPDSGKLVSKRDPLHSAAPRRRRRKPDAAEGEILDAAESFLKEKPFREMTVDDIMGRTGLSRPSFYEYFRDRHHMMIKLADRLGDWTLSAGEQWLSGSDTNHLPDLETGIRNLVAVTRDRGYLLRALYDAAIHDKQVELTYRNLMARFIDATAARIERGVTNGAMKGLNPHEIATALVLMNERYLLERMRDQAVDSATLVNTLFTVWNRVLYG